MLHQKNKESLQDKQLKDKNRAVAKRENEREMLRKKQQNMQMNSHEPEGEMVEATYPSDFKESLMVLRKLLPGKRLVDLMHKVLKVARKKLMRQDLLLMLTKRRCFRRNN